MNLFLGGSIISYSTEKISGLTCLRKLAIWGLIKIFMACASIQIPLSNKQA